MGYTAIAVALLGSAAGVLFRLKVLLAFVGALLIATVIFSFSRGFSFRETALTIIVAQSLLQSGYFIGLVIKSRCQSVHRLRRVI